MIPAILPTFDLTPWTGWSFVGEPDLFILATIGILAIRAPVRRQDFILTGWAGRILLLLVCVYCANVVIGLALPGPFGGSDNPYLRPDNALRLAKGFIAALALLPFFRARQRVNRDAVQMFGFGMITGLTGVCLAAVVERALFPGLFDFTSDYRIVATFSSMHLGGGHIGAYIAMALPFLIACCIRPGLVGIGAAVSIALVGGYTLVVTYARTAYVAALVGLCTAFAGWVLGLRHSRDATRFTALLPALILTVVSAIVVAATLMPERLETVADDLGTREGNWIGGLALRDNGAVAALVGMGLGTYPRVALSHSHGLHAPTNFLVRHEGDNSALSLHAGSSTYLTQRVPIEPDQSYTISLKLRSLDGEGKLSALLCENMLLYSVNCQSVGFEAAHDGTWRDLTATLSSIGLREHPLFGLIRRPVELSLSDSVLGSTIEIENVKLVSPHGLDIVANGDFGQGMSRWYFTDDDHLAWRIKNQYLMTLFECGTLGLGVLLLTALGGIGGAVKSLLRGNLMAAAIAASLVAFLCSSAFDYLLEVPRLATLFYLICFIGLDYGATQRDDPSPVRATT